MLLSVKDLLQELVRIPSVNPAFLLDDKIPRGGEAALTDFLQNFFQSRGLPWLRQTVHDGRDNLVVVYRASGSAARRQPVLWEVHQDTVGVEGMKIDPFAAAESEGRIWGRGACDVKGGMAAMLAALARVEAQNVALRQTIVLALTINEECGFTGVKALCRLWDRGGQPDQAGQPPACEQFAECAHPRDADAKASTTGPDRQGVTQAAAGISGSLSLKELVALRPARAIVAEPTSLDVVVAHKGSLRWRCHTHGKAAHTSRPEQGCNAILTMVRVVQAIEQYHVEVLSRRQPHPLCGRPTVCVSTIRGGSGVNTVPDHTVIDIDRRLLPGETPTEAYRELVEFIAARVRGNPMEAALAGIEHTSPSTLSDGLQETDGAGRSNRDWAAEIASTVNAVEAGSGNQPSRLIGVPYGTDAWALSAAGIPSVVFGPGSIDQAHTNNEWIDVEQLERATEVFYRLACGD